MKKYFFLVIILLLSNISLVFADSAVTTGFIPGQIWYSQEPLIEGETVKVYTAIWNGDKNTLSARIEFYDKNVILGSRDITIQPSQLQDVYISWKVTAGDHTISAKIVSASIVNDGKKEQITLDRSSTLGDKTFVSVVNTNNTETTKAVDTLKNEVDKASTIVKSSIPLSVVTPISTSFSTIDDFRDTTYAKIVDVKEQSQKELDALNNPVKINKNIKDTPKVATKTEKPLDATEKPITYIKLFLFSLLGFIFGNKIIFYSLLTFLTFIILRFFYRKIRNR